MTRLVRFALLFLALSSPILGSTPASAAATGSGVVSNYSAAGVDQPEGIAAGPDGALWFANSAGNSIGRISTLGAITNYAGTGISRPSGVAAGSDGALWFTNFSNNSIGRITTAGTVSNFSNSSIRAPYGITAGPDGALWFTNLGNNSIGRITTSGVITNFTALSITGAIWITVGPDHALWFANCIAVSSAAGPVCSNSGGSIGRMTTTGTVTNFASPKISVPGGIVAGPDGALWFTNFGNNSIGRITTTGGVTTYPGVAVHPEGIAVGRDGALWFTNSGGDSIGRITTAGVASTFTGSGISDPIGIASGSDGALWFTNVVGDSIGRITVAPPTLTPGTGSVTEGNSGTSALHVPVTLSNPSPQTVTAHWRTVFVPGAPAHQADPASDYVPASGTVTFAPGTTTSRVTITVKGDRLVEPNEYIVVEFESATNATLGGFYGLGFGAINNDD